MFDFLNKHRRYILSRHNIPATQADAQGTIAVSSVVIPCTGADYIEEAVLSAYLPAAAPTPSAKLSSSAISLPALFRRCRHACVW